MMVLLLFLAMLPGTTLTPSQWRDRVVAQEARRAGVSPALAVAVSHVENWSGDRFAISRTGCCLGVMQVNVSVWSKAFLEECGEHSLTDVRTNACVGVMILRHYLHRTRSTHQALAAYYGEPWDGARYVRKVERRLGR
jgi:soluble lytic murein transglycosylase-like protein